MGWEGVYSRVRVRAGEGWTGALGNEGGPSVAGRQAGWQTDILQHYNKQDLARIGHINGVVI